MISIRRSEERGHLNFGWLDTHHTFSFGSYYDPAHMGVSKLRVLNDDRVAAGEGFPPHGHADMEILSYVLDGALEHRDSLGNGSVIEAGQFQRMTAGTGVTHSEFNARDDQASHFLQIWIQPSARGLAPGYEELRAADLPKPVALVASGAGEAGAMTVHQDVRVLLLRPEAGEAITHALSPGRTAYVHLIAGDLRIQASDGSSEAQLAEGDGATLTGSETFSLVSSTTAHALLFDLP